MYSEKMVSSASTAYSTACASGWPQVMASGTPGNVTLMPSLSRLNFAGSTIMGSLLHLRRAPETGLFLDALDRGGCRLHSDGIQICILLSRPGMSIWSARSVWLGSRNINGNLIRNGNWNKKSTGIKRSIVALIERRCGVDY